MAFKLKSRPNGGHPAFVYPATMKANEAGTIGEAVAWDATGTLTKCAADAAPVYILQASVAAAASPTVKPPCILVDDGQEWETTMGEVNANPAAVVVGTKLTLHTDGLTLSYVTTSGDGIHIGRFEVTALENTGKAVVGDKVSGFFRPY